MESDSAARTFMGCSRLTHPHPLEDVMRFSALLAFATVVSTACSNPVDSTASPELNLRQGQGAEQASDAATRSYDVTITNLTGGQPLSPAVLATHSQNLRLFEVGGLASEGIRLIAENGDPSTAAAALQGVLGVAEVVTTGAPVGVIGGSAFPSSLTIRIGARGDANRLSLATMLICTNDGFTGLNSVKLPGGFQPESWYANGYDAGTEANTEADGDIVPPCFGLTGVAGGGGGGRTAESGTITMHPGIVGGSALVPAVNGWTGPVARITVQRVK